MAILGKRHIYVLTMALVLLALAAPGGDVEGATFLVDNEFDAHDDSPGDGACSAGQVGVCTLRAAIEQANNTEGADTVVLPAGNYLLNLGQIEIWGSDGLDLQGDGPESTIVGVDPASWLATRILLIRANAKVTITGVTFRDGVLRYDAEPCVGGAILNQGDLSMVNCDLSDNVAGSDNPVSACGAGAISNSGQLTLTDCVLTGNKAWGAHGGAIGNSGEMSLTRVDLIGNAATDYGGAISNSGTIDMTECTIDSNTASRGGAISQWSGGVLTITQSTLSSNQATSAGGGLYIQGSAIISDSTFAQNFAGGGEAPYNYGAGGALYSDGGTLTITDSILDGNNAPGPGGAIYLDHAITQLAASDLKYSGCEQVDGGVAGACCLTSNKSGDDGGAIYLENQSELNVRGCTFRADRAAGDGGGIMSSDSSEREQ